MNYFASHARTEMQPELQAEMEQQRKFGELLKQVDAAASAMGTQLGILNRARAYRAKDASEALRMQRQAGQARDQVIETYRQLAILLREALAIDERLVITHERT